MKVLVGCEYSQRVTAAFRLAGHDAYSCDILPTEGNPAFHIQGNILEYLSERWDLGIFHPPCTRLTNSGVLRLYYDGKKENGIDPVKWAEMIEAANFFKLLLNAPIKKIAVENPVPHGYALEIIGEKYSQIIQPYNFNEDASKKTCLWLKGLPKLQNTGYYPPRTVDGKPRWSNQTDSGQNNLGPSPERWKDRSRTYPGIAAAMAKQWGGNNKNHVIHQQLKFEYE